ncbi:MAG: DUF1800 family protein, partial [Verrucomicrobiales bacterium]|nr:DUF1800 family protein [Verrucomicrobiales bacterium]
GSGFPIFELGYGAAYFVGTEEPSPSAGGGATTDWAQPGFVESGWIMGATPIGYGEDGLGSTIDNSEGGFWSLYSRQTFVVDDVDGIQNLVLRLGYDDGFVAYLNGTEVARANVTGSPPAWNRRSDRVGGSIDGDVEFEFDITQVGLPLLSEGENLLAIQTHNTSLSSSDLIVAPELIDMPPAPYRAVRGKSALKQMLHLRGIYSRKQLQAVLGEFWENHFTTDFDKVEEFLLDIDEYDDIADLGGLEEDRIELQAEIEAARIEWEEYEFFYENGLGNFGDLLLYSATSPSMLIYLDNVLNLKDAPNENYAREIFELSAFGVDNRYSQQDLEQLARCFTGWSVRKIPAGLKPTFPDSARTPPVTPTRTVETETAILEIGESWKYFKGTAEPSPGASDEATTDWAMAGFDDSAGNGWLEGGTGIGARDGDDLTLLPESEFPSQYHTIYLRKEFTIPAMDPGKDLVLQVKYDDGFVAYLNGTEIGRSYSLRERGSPPSYTQFASSHEATGDPKLIDLNEYADLINEGGTNLLAIQVHNSSATNRDLSILPRIVELSYTEDSIDIVDPTGLWTFRFNPDEHDTGDKTIFAGTPYEIQVDGAEGVDGVNEAIRVIDAMVGHPSTAEFICIKLVNRFVSDGISLDTYHGRSAPDHLLGAVDEAIQAWNSTAPAGNIGTVMRTILDPAFRSSAFWSEGAYLGKVKTPIEYVNSVVRALDATVTDNDLRRRIADQGMSFFDRDDPNGYSEIGSDWVDTLSVLERMRFSQATAGNLSQSATRWDPLGWETVTFPENGGAVTSEELIGYFDSFLFQGTMSDERKAVISEFANTDNAGVESRLENLSGSRRRDRLEATVALILSSPEFQYQ